ncbi:TonB-dependent receptor domain-containing protein [Phenylobacterium montanum]|uniref:TonB-dependent receptor n=1 Tax=Phenylobacterium montanum TaxID=2823693 RepID=A0A975FWX4_9CAUL|nr:TonB-dependent receptor [Caulobacter sp. S6]QUD86764.1 TonB-dependent receptor [Caulobacter sp. S6]
MKINTTRAALLASTVLCGAIALSASAASAQTAPAAQGAAAAQTTNEIIVTGTRIKGASNATSASPISVATSASISLTKADSVEEVLQHMTGADFTGGLSNASNNGGVGLSEVSLRNLGPARALVLIDGQRTVPVYSGSLSTPDLNSVPLSMVDRLEVLRDGASSIYGADAIGGVINIITKKNFSGMQMDASYGESGHGDGAVYSVGGAIGVNSDRGNVMVSLNWDHRDSIGQWQRDWAIDPHIGSPAEGGSAYRSQLDILQEESGSLVWANGQQLNKHDGTVNWGAIDPSLLYLPNVGKVKMNAGRNDWNALTGGLDRKQISFNAHYNLTDNLRFIMDGFFTNRDSNQALRPEPLLGDNISTVQPGTSNVLWPGFQLPDSVFTSAGFAAPAASDNHFFYLTPNQFGPRTYRQNSQTYRVRAGFEGTLFDKYDWEAGYVFQENYNRADTLNEGNFNHIAQLSGQIACVDVPGGCKPGTLIDGTASTVPVTMPNWLGGPNNIFTPAQLAYATFNNIDLSYARESYGYANISGPIWDLPAGELKGSIGGEIRQEFLSNTPSDIVQQGWGPNASAPTAGGFNVASVFGELNIPVLKDLPFIESLTLTPSARYDNYTNFGAAFTNKVGIEYKVDRDIRFRASYSTGFRAPSTAELFGGNFVSDLPVDGDPCDSRGSAFGASSGNSNIGVGVLSAGSNCAKALAGVTGALDGTGKVTNFQPAYDEGSATQQQVLEGGNPKLKPELSEQYALGVVFTPRWVEGFSFSIDYYDIRISNAILTGGFGGNQPDVVVNGCYGPAQNQFYCNLISRNPATGGITQITSPNVNFGVEKVRGIDYQFDYDTAAAHLTLPIPGSFRFDLQISNLMKHSTQNPDGTNNNYAGTFNTSAEFVQPRWKGTAAVDYHLGPWTAHWDGQYIGQTHNNDGSAPAEGNKIGDTWYNNISASYTFSDFGFMKKARVTLGIDNVADQDPPFLNSDAVCKCNSIAGPYDFVGRFFYGRISTSF